MNKFSNINVEWNSSFYLVVDVSSSWFCVLDLEEQNKNESVESHTSNIGDNWIV